MLLPPGVGGAGGSVKAIHKGCPPMFGLQQGGGGETAADECKQFLEEFKAVFTWTAAPNHNGWSLSNTNCKFLYRTEPFVNVCARMCVRALSSHMLPWGPGWRGGKGSPLQQLPGWGFNIPFIVAAGIIPATWNCRLKRILPEYQIGTTIFLLHCHDRYSLEH